MPKKIGKINSVLKPHPPAPTSPTGRCALYACAQQAPCANADAGNAAAGFLVGHYKVNPKYFQYVVQAHKYF